VKKGPPFRKKIYTAMHLLMPFDPLRMQDLLVWQNYMGKDENLMELESRLIADNSYYKRENIFSSHKPLCRRAGLKSPDESSQPKKSSIELPFDKEELRNEMNLGYIPGFFFAEGVVISMLLSGLFGIPLVFLGVILIIRLVFELRSIKKADGLWQDMHRVSAEGKVEAQFMEDIIEAPWFFLNMEGRPIPLVLRQMLRNDDSMLDFAGDQVKVEGIFKARNTPYIDITKISRLTGKPKAAAGGYYPLMFFAGIGLTLTGILMIAVEVMTK
jgi:hypothetical protein